MTADLTAWFTAKLAGKLPEFMKINSGETLNSAAAVRKYIAVQLARSTQKGNNGQIAIYHLEHLKTLIEKL